MNLSMIVSGGSNQISKDPDESIRDPKRSTYQHLLLDGDRTESLRSVYYRIEENWETVGETQSEALRALLYKDELIYLDDGDVPPLIQTKNIYVNATYTFSGVTSPSSTHKAYTDSSASEPSAESDFETSEYSTANYQAVDGDDANAVETTDPTAGKYLYHKFNILSGIVTADVQRVRIRISVLSNDGSPVNTDGVVMYGWNQTSWQELARMSSYGAGSTSAYLNYSTFDSTMAQSLVDSSDHYIRILVQTRNQRVTTNSLNLKMYYVEVEVNEGLSEVVTLLNTPVLTASDVVWVKNLTTVQTLELTTDYTISGKEVTIIGEDAGDEIEVKYNRVFEGRIRETIERWQAGNPEGDRNRELLLRYESLSPEVVGS